MSAREEDGEGRCRAVRAMTVVVTLALLDAVHAATLDRRLGTVPRVENPGAQLQSALGWFTKALPTWLAE